MADNTLSISPCKYYWENIYSIFSSNSEANVAELRGNIEEMFHHYWQESVDHQKTIDRNLLSKTPVSNS